MNTHAFLAHLEARARGIAWARNVSKRAVLVERDDRRQGYRILHATKGWRFVSDRRLALA